MHTLSSLVHKAVVSGTVASAVSAAVLALLAKLEGAAPVQPINATSHWRYGEDALKVTGINTRHTGTGLATHHAACVFWASLFESIRSAAPDRRSALIVRDAGAVSLIAAIVDYGLVPTRLTPGWEGPLPIRSVAGGFAALALGLTIGGLITCRRG